MTLNNYTIDDFVTQIMVEIRQYQQLHGIYPNVTQWSKEFNRCPKTLKRRGLNWNDLVEFSFSKTEMKQMNLSMDKPTEKIYDKSVVELDEILSSIKTVQKINDGINPKTSYTVINHKDVTEPIALVFTGDWHLGSNHSDYSKWQSDMLFLMGLPPERVKLITTGDLIDNFFPKFRSAEPVFGTISPATQKVFLSKIVDLLKPYLEISCWGNHDVEWDEKADGTSTIAKLLEDNSVYFYGQGYIDYILSDETYKISLNHVLKGSSAFHNLQGQLKEWNKSHCEIVVGAHTHSPAVMRDTFGNYPDGTPRRRYLIQVGTYKDGEDTYGMRYFSRGAIENTTLVLYPDQHKIVEFDCVEDAAKWMGLKNKNYKTFKEVEKDRK